MKNIHKRFLLYICGLFLLALGASLSIRANLGVSPVTSLAYSLHLTCHFSMGLATVGANVLFIIVQSLLNRSVDLRESAAQLLLSFVFGFFMDATLWVLAWLPEAQSVWLQVVYLVISLWVIALGLIAYFTPKLPLMPYDALSFAIKNRFQLTFARAKISGDVVNVFAAATLCWLVLHRWGAIGIGTFVAAIGIGKIMGWLLPHVQPILLHWLRLNRHNKARLRQWQEQTKPH